MLPYCSHVASSDISSVFDRVASLRVGSGQSSDSPAGSGWSRVIIVHKFSILLSCPFLVFDQREQPFVGLFLAPSLDQGAWHCAVSWVPRLLVSLPSLCLSDFYVGFYIMSWALHFFFFYFCFLRGVKKSTPIPSSWK